MEDRVNILIVDDRPDNLLVLETILSPLGDNLIRAQSGEEALREVLKRDFAVILLDAHMPGMDGYETASLLQNRHRSASTPVIFITANDPDRRRVASVYAAGAVDYLVKPFEPEILCSKVKVFTNLHRKTIQVERQALELKLQIKLQRQLIEDNHVLEQQLADRAAEAEHRAGLLRLMSIELTQAEQRERRRLSQILHDHLQQILVAARFKLGVLDRTRKSQTNIRGAIKELDELLGQALESSRSLTVELSPPVLYDGELTVAFQWLGRHMLDKHGVAVDLDLKIGEAALLDAVKALLFYAVRELLFNAIKHAGVDLVRLKAEVVDGEICIRVEDEGNGFDATMLNNEDEMGESFGLLSIRKRLEVFGGRFQIHSRPGKGTRATLWAPVQIFKKMPETVHSAVPSAERDARPARIPSAAAGSDLQRLILVDDHDILREGLATLLRDMQDLEIVGQARTGEDSITLARQLQPDVIIMDISLPGISGLEATRLILREFPKTRVIALSMHDAADMEPIALKAGARAFLSKHEPTEKLIDLIRNVKLDSEPQPADSIDELLAAAEDAIRLSEPVSDTAS